MGRRMLRAFLCLRQLVFNIKNFLNTSNGVFIVVVLVVKYNLCRLLKKQTINEMSGPGLDWTGPDWTREAGKIISVENFFSGRDC